jgi:prepilin-type N-terminal cleavage/methylation domain-containing protein
VISSRNNLVFAPSLAHRDARSLRGYKGFSLIELLLAMLILTALTGIAVAVYAEAQRTVQMQLSSSTLNSNAVGALNQMAQEIRMAGFPSAGSFTAAAVASYPGLVAMPFVAISGYELQFEANIGGQGSVQRIEYLLPPGTQTLLRLCTQKGLDGTLLTGTTVSAPFLMNVQNQLQGMPLFTWNTNPFSRSQFPQNVRTVYINLITVSNGNGSGLPVNVTLRATCTRMNP